MPNERMAKPITRRRALTVMAAAASMPLSGAAQGRSPAPELEWRGRALGGPAKIVIRHIDEVKAQRLVGHCVSEIRRLEAVFSLFHSDSEISRLNKAGRLTAPSQDLRIVLSAARRFGQISDGAFDVTVQPLWRAYRAHFAADPDSRTIPDLDRQQALVDYREIHLDNGGVAFARPGMEVTLNGIAQGYITDRIGDMLRDAGLSGVLVDIGEIRAFDAPDGEGWRVGIEDPRAPGTVATRMDLRGAALATSGGYGARFDKDGLFHHLFDPMTGRSANACLSASAVAGDAMSADALATAMAVAGPERAGDLLRSFRGRRARLVLPDGTVQEFEA